MRGLRMRVIVLAAGAGTSIALALATPALAEGTDTPVPSDVYCTTYYPSANPTDVVTGEPSEVPPSTTGSGVVSETAVGSGSAAPTDVLSESDTAPPPSEVLSDSLVNSDTATATEVPSGPFTACVAGEEGGGVDGPATATTTREPIANTGSDTRRALLIAALLIVLGSFVGLLGSRLTRPDRAH